jgi:nitroreductase
MQLLHAHLLDAAGRAPSAHNTQPWLLRFQPGALEIRVRPERALPAADPTGADVLHSIGALLENVLLTLAHLGQEAAYEIADTVSGETPLVTVRWCATEAPPPDPTLYRMIPIRSTSRLPYDPAPIAPEILATLQAVTSPPCELHVLTDPDATREVRALVATATAVQLADPPVAAELYGWLRFSPRDRRWYRDGLNAACMGWRSWEAAAIRLLLAPATLRLLAPLGLHRALCANVDQQAPPAPALCLLTIAGMEGSAPPGIAERIEAGRTLQRIWLTATAHGLVTHPLSAAVDVPQTRPRVLARFGVSPDRHHVNLFRLGRSAPPARSPRLPADEIVELRLQ